MNDLSHVSNDLVTLLIPTHNRHDYLARILDYYKQAPFPILVADSSTRTYEEKQALHHSIQYLHLPAESLPSKLEIAAHAVKTPYLVMCADDDFIIPSAIFSCIEFLKRNKDYSCAQGNAISYKKMPQYMEEMDLSLMYKHILSFSIAQEDPYERLVSFFSDYRTLFYGVHYTSNLRLAFNNNAAVIKNLYLNEYVTGIVPIVAGKYKELNVLYQVREYSEQSGDKTTVNLDAIAYEEKYANEFDAYIELLAGKLSMLGDAGKEINQEKLSRLLKQFANTLKRNKPLSFKKKIGKRVASFPYFGNLLIEYNRKLEKTNELKQVIKTEADMKELKSVETVIRNYASLIK